MGVREKVLNMKTLYILPLMIILLLSLPSANCEADHKQEYEKRIEEYTIQIEDNPQSAMNYYGRGRIYLELGQYDNAINDFNRSITIKNNISIVYHALSRAYIGRGRYSDALQAIENAIRIRPSITDYYQRAICYDNLKMIPQAIEDYTRFINSKPVLKSKDDRLDLPKEYFNSHKRRALLYFQIQKFEKTVEDVTEALNIYDKDPMLYSMRGHSYYNLGKLDESLNDLEQSIKVDSSYSFSYVQIARVYAARGEKEKTEKYVTRALKKGFSDYEILYAMTEIVDVLGKERIDALIARYSKKS